MKDLIEQAVADFGQKFAHKIANPAHFVPHIRMMLTTLTEAAIDAILKLYQTNENL